MGKAIFRADNCSFTKNPALLKSGRYMGSGSTPSTIENANFVEIGELINGEREIRKVTTPKADTAYFGIVCTPEVEYNEVGYHGLDTFENKDDDVIRIGILEKGDIYSATTEAFDGTPSVGKFIELQAGTKGKVVTSATAGSTKVGKVIAVEQCGKFTYYVIEVQ